MTPSTHTQTLEAPCWKENPLQADYEFHRIAGIPMWPESTAIRVSETFHTCVDYSPLDRTCGEWRVTPASYQPRWHCPIRYDPRRYTWTMSEISDSSQATNSFPHYYRCDEEYDLFSECEDINMDSPFSIIFH